MQANKTLFITGHPGVGKTITSKMLVLYYAAMGYRVRFSTNVTDLDELKKSLSRNPDIKEVILVDDCFGQAYFNMKESQNAELLSLINYVNLSKNKLLILNSRITILQEAKERKQELLKCFEGKQCKVYVLDMKAISLVEKAKILYNHISFYSMDKTYFAEIKKDKRYYDIVRHPNYTPRIIEFVCNPIHYKEILPENYYDYVMQQLNNPKEIWKDEYERRIEKVDRLLLLTIYSLSDSVVSETKVRECFEYRISREASIDTTINQYEASLSRLLTSFVQSVYDNGIKKLAMINPSVNDYIDGCMNASSSAREELINYSFHIQQKKRLLSEREFDIFVKSALENHEIEKYWFDSDSQRNAFITFYVNKYKIFDNIYTTYIQSFLATPCNLCIYGNETITKIDIYRIVLEKDICNFYQIREFLNRDHILDSLLDKFDFYEMSQVILGIERFFKGDRRDIFVDVTSKYLMNAIQKYCCDLNIDEFDMDIYQAIKMSHDTDDKSNEIDIDKVVSYIKNEINLLVMDEIDSLLSMLPEDIRHYQNYINEIKECSICGVEDAVNYYLEGYDYDYDEDFCESFDEYENHSTEIDYVFNRE